MPESSPPRMLSAPLRLTAMTLRGLGPYLHGARLEIKPLTILCGENGSGKSTWIDVLRSLKNLSSPERPFPFVYLTGPTAIERAESELDTHYTANEGSHFQKSEINANFLIQDENSQFAQESKERKKSQQLIEEARRRRLELMASKDDEKFGPVGTIGLEIEVTDDLKSRLAPPAAERWVMQSSALEELLFDGRLPKKNRLRIRWAMPSLSESTGEVGLDDLIELSIADAHVIRLNRSKGKWKLECSAGFLLHGSKLEAELCEIAEVAGPGFKTPARVIQVSDKCPLNQECVQELLRLFLEVFSAVVRLALEGFFHVGPIRSIQNADSNIHQAPTYSDSPPYLWHPPSESPGRWVGKDGEHTSDCYLYWSYNPMCQPRNSKEVKTYPFEVFASYWLDALTGAKLELRPIGHPTWPHGDQPPNGGLIDGEWNWIPRELVKEEEDGHWFPIRQGDMSRILRPSTSTSSAAWHVMSTGFHQLAPIVVQAGLLRQNEIMAVENPEAHLHPSLQIKVAEFLMHQANAGKIMLIETHSDLIVRRVLRAIREEQVSLGNVFKQASVGINFTSLDHDDQHGFKHAKIEELKINDQGQIGNWPDGFMDDDLKEANNWLASMERLRSLDDEE